jgi:hypothetical protein
MKSGTQCDITINLHILLLYSKFRYKSVAFLLAYRGNVAKD